MVVHNNPGSGWMMSGDGGGVESCSFSDFLKLSNGDGRRCTKVSNICGMYINKSGNTSTTSNGDDENIQEFSNDETAKRAINRVSSRIRGSGSEI